MRSISREKESSCLLKKALEWLHEAGEDEVDLRVEGVGTDVGTPGAEYGVGCFEHTDVDCVFGSR